MAKKSSRRAAKSRGRPRPSPRRKPAPRGSAAKPKLLAGGNPQIAKGDGEAPVRAYIEAMPGWKRDAGGWLDALIGRAVPNVRRAVRWNQPFYGTADRGWFLGVHCLTRYIKIAFFNGTSLRPMPPVESKNKGTRYFHIHEDEWARGLDEAQVTDWIKQASALPGWASFNC